MAALLALGGSAASAKPDKGPVRVECAVPAGMKTGDEVDVVVRFRALANIQQLSVRVFADKDLEVLSETQEAVFVNVARDAASELPVRVRLTGTKWGSLAVTYQARISAGTASDGFQIIFGGTK